MIGYDARHNSDVFARDTAEVMTGAGFKAHVLPRPLPTPLLAFAIRELGCVAGVMVTASHNPPEDNGYKVYLGDGSQIVPPADAGIAARIAAVGAAGRGAARGRRQGPRRGLVDRYLDTVADLAADGPRDLDIVSTPLHGVGGAPVLQVLEPAGFDAPSVVARRRSPTRSSRPSPSPIPRSPARWTSPWRSRRRSAPTSWSPTTRTPTGAPAAVPSPHGWRMLRGDEVGALLADTCCARASGEYAASIVSSSLLGKMAAAEGQAYAETLTGFKWIGRVPDLAFGYEEALGYCVDPTT